MATINEIDAAFHDPARRAPVVSRLGGGDIARTASGAPWRVLGQEHAIYALRQASGQVLGLRVPLTAGAASAERLAHWEALAQADSLAGLRVAGGPLPAMLRVDRAGVLLTPTSGSPIPTPVIVMEYFGGGSLRQAVTDAVQRGDRKGLSRLARGMAMLALGLERAGFDHGNLTPETVMLREDGRFGLIGLGGAWWPDAPGDAPRANRDRPMTMLLFTELLALAAEPSLPSEAPWHGALVLSEADLTHPDASRVLERWVASPDPLAAAAAGTVRDVFGRRIGVPSFTDFAALIEAQAIPAVRDEGVVKETPAPVFEPEQVAPVVIVPTPEEAAAAADRVARAVRRRDTATVEGWWGTARHHPTAGLIAPEVQVLLDTDIERATQRAIESNDAKAAAVAIERADANGVVLDPTLRRSARELQRQAADAQAVRVAIEQRDVDAIADLAAIGAISDASGLTHREALARDRALAWPRLARALASDDDRLILAAWDPAVLTGDPSITPEREERIRLAQQRVTWLDYVREAMRTGDREGLSDLLGDIPPGIDTRLTATERQRIARMMQASEALTRFRRAQRSGSDSDVVDAAEALERTGIPYPADTDWQTLLAARARVARLRAIREATADTPIDWGQVGVLVAAAQDAGMQGYRPDESAWLAEMERQVLRERTARSVREAIRRGDLHAVAAEVVPDGLGVLEVLTPEERAEVARAARVAVGRSMDVGGDPRDDGGMTPAI